MSSEELLAEQETFKATVAAGVFSVYEKEFVFNMDETAVYYEDDPGRIIAEKGSKKNTKVKGKRRSNRVSVLLTISATGRKLKPLIIFKGQPGGTIEEELKSFPVGAVYAVQANAWMDSRVWLEYVADKLWSGYVNTEYNGPCALFLDNLKSHVSEESMEAFADLGTELVPLPKHTTSVLQPLDVGVMGPFKRIVRAMALTYEVSAVNENTSIPLRERLTILHKKPTKEKRRIIVERIIKAWDQVSTSAVVRSWEKSLFSEL